MAPVNEGSSTHASAKESAGSPSLGAPSALVSCHQGACGNYQLSQQPRVVGGRIDGIVVEQLRERAVGLGLEYVQRACRQSARTIEGER